MANGNKPAQYKPARNGEETPNPTSGILHLDFRAAYLSVWVCNLYIFPLCSLEYLSRYRNFSLLINMTVHD